MWGNRMLIRSRSAGTYILCALILDTAEASELWWAPNVLGRQDDLQLLLSQQARSTLGYLRTTALRPLMRETRLTEAEVLLDARQQWYTSRLGNKCKIAVRYCISDNWKKYDQVTLEVIVGTICRGGESGNYVIGMKCSYRPAGRIHGVYTGVLSMGGKSCNWLSFKNGWMVWSRDHFSSQFHRLDFIMTARLAKGN